MATDLATLAISLENTQAIAAAKATTAALVDMGAKGETAAKKVAASANPVEQAIVRQAVAVKKAAIAFESLHASAVDFARAGATASQIAQLTGSSMSAAATAVKKYADTAARGTLETRGLKAAHEQMAMAGMKAGATFGVVEKAATGSARGLNMVRSSMTAVAASVLQTAPGVAQLSGALGTMAIGSAMMVGVMAGVALLGLAWRELTKDARALKEETKALIDKMHEYAEARRLGETGERGKGIAALNQELAGVQERIKADQSVVDAIKLSNRARSDEDTRADLSREARLAKNRALESRYLADIKEVNAGIVESHVATHTKIADDARTAAEKLQAERDRAAKEMLRKEKESLDAIIDLRVQAMQREAQFARNIRGIGLLPSAGTVTQPYSQSDQNVKDRLRAQLDAGSDDIRYRSQQQRDSWGQTSQAAGNQTESFVGALGAFVSAIGPAIIAAKLIEGVMKSLAGPIEALLSPIVMLGEVIGKALLPILKAFWPVIRDTVIAFTYVAQVFFKIGGLLMEVIGTVVKAIGDLLNKLPGSIGNPLVKWGRDMIEQGKEFQQSAKDMATLRGELKDMSFEDAMNGMADAANRASAALLNVPQGFKIALERYRATVGETAPPGTTAGPWVPSSGKPGSGSGKGATQAARGGDVFHIQITTQAKDGKTVWREIQDEVRRERARGGTTTFDVAVA